MTNTSNRTYVELKCRTHYSFLRGASHPHELVEQALKLGLKGLAITDLHGVYGLPKAYLAARAHPELKLISGAEVQIEGLSRLSLICKTRAGYGLLCRILTQAHIDKPKGGAFLKWEELMAFLQKPESLGLIALPTLELSSGDSQKLDWKWGDLKDLLKDRLYLPLVRSLDGHDEQRTRQAQKISRRYQIEFVASNDVHYHKPSRRDLQDVLTSIRGGIPLERAGFLLFSNQERYLKSYDQMTGLFSDLPSALETTLKIADQCQFSLSELRYRYPSEWIPEGYTAQSYLSELVWKGAQWRYPDGIPQDVFRQLQYELQLVDELRFADYFLTIWEIVEFARQRKILCQGRGSAANSVICYVLGITAIDPVRMKLLFERFISAERGEPPDIDVDFEHERREEVIQHIYEKYGRHRAGMVAAVVTYRSRSSIREVTKAFGREMSKREFLQEGEEPQPSPQWDIQNRIIEELHGFPRHLSIHSGGFTLSADPLIETVPIEPARMEGRTIVQWDKYDLDVLGLLKVDILALGMLSVLRKTMDYANKGLTLAHIPADDPPTYEMIRRADTVGTFQIESRAQMAMLPRLLPKNFYDLVVQVALVRPGPIVGKMVHPYLKRRKGLEPAALPDPRLEPILGRTLGVPIFQEQVMKMAITLAEFTPGEADQLRRAIGAWRSSGSIDQMGKRLMAGLLTNGIPKDFADLIFQQIQGFSEYGFPESHAASFALLAYASAYLKRHQPAEFLCALLNSQPMGFYAAHTLIDDAKRHGVKIHPIHPHYSNWECEMENGGVRLGFCYIPGASEKEVKALIVRRESQRFTGFADFLDRSGLKKNIIRRLAQGDAFTCFGYHQRQALWEILAYEILNDSKSPIQLNLFSQLNPSQSQTSASHSFVQLSQDESITTDYEAYGFSVRGHPMQALRKKYPRLSKITTAQAKRASHDSWIQVPGLSVIVQRPPTAAGTVFATIEDETGFLDLIFHRAVFEKYQELIWDQCFLLVSGKIQRDGLSVSLIVKHLKPFMKEQLG
jgi:error-prone DNA polymerase